ncbi:MAG: tRNA preQ1(34) S-adenosylmethionine ribosyltransferase-isomerase QueA [Pseudomonadota bacterium]
MNIHDFHFDLPDELIAHYPPTHRTDSRLLCMDRVSGKLDHRNFVDFPILLKAGDLLVFNNSKVIPARLAAHKDTGGKVEVLLERVRPENAVLAQIRGGKGLNLGSKLWFTDDDGSRFPAVMMGREGEFFHLQFDTSINLMGLFERIGTMPLPPYIKRQAENSDRERYQTVYAERQGAVAAPTAGLHFDQNMLDLIKANGVALATVTLHVGAGTFQPIRVQNIADHQMHAEYVEVSQSVCDQVRACKVRGGKVIAIGTTTVRCLETASQSGELKSYQGETRIFIYPGYKFNVVDALLTNFHLPESTLLMLVSAFSSRDNILAAYNSAVGEKYRFFSYGDAMFIS